MWQFIDTGFGTGKFNMDYDLELAKNFSGTPSLRIYRWQPFCISLGANQDIHTIYSEKASQNGLEIVKRPTGGRAILHAEELTYSVIIPLSVENPPKKIYRDINNALREGLINYDPLFTKIELEHTQPHFPSFYKEDKSTLCFAVSAMNELNYKGRKVVGSAQRKLGNIILQHGTILCGPFHKKVTEYLNLLPKNILEIKGEIEETTTELETILGKKINYETLAVSIKKGFEQHFNIEFNNELVDEKVLQVN